MRIHIILQSKGGVGKSFAASSLAQFKMEANGPETVRCFDVDPGNHSLCSFKALGATEASLIENGVIVEQKWDEWVEDVLALTDVQDVIVDVGASTFIPFNAFILGNNLPSFFAKLDHRLTLHTVISGGPPLHDTLTGATALAHQYKDLVEFVDLAIWTNPHLGPLAYLQTDLGKMDAFIKLQKLAYSIVEIPDTQPKGSLFRGAINDLLSQRLTFNEGINDPHRPILVRQRIHILKEQLFASLSAANV